MTPEQADQFLQAITRLQPVLRRFVQANMAFADRMREMLAVVRMRLENSSGGTVETRDRGRTIMYRYGGVPDDSAPRDPHAGYCWACNKVEVPSDPEHFGVCDACLVTLRGESTQ